MLIDTCLNCPQMQTPLHKGKELPSVCTECSKPINQLTVCPRQERSKTEHIDNVHKSIKHMNVMEKRYSGWTNLYFGPPKASETSLTVEELEAEGMVGVYGNRINDIWEAINRAISPEKKK